MRCLLVSLFLVGNTASAENFDPHVLLDACMKETRIEMCRDLSNSKDGSEKLGLHILKDLHMLDFASVVGTAAKIGIDRKVAFTDKSNWWFAPGKERSIEIGEHQAMLIFKWPLPW